MRHLMSPLDFTVEELEKLLVVLRRFLPSVTPPFLVVI